LTNNQIGNDGAQLMADVLLHTQTLLKLNLSMNGIGVRGAKVIGKALQSNTVSIILFLSLISMLYN
jgi:Ran GTPase-activating protein (RanGAP) involved in mRNA processing and transport